MWPTRGTWDRLPRPRHRKRLPGAPPSAAKMTQQVRGTSGEGGHQQATDEEHGTINRFGLLFRRFVISYVERVLFVNIASLLCIDGDFPSGTYIYLTHVYLTYIYPPITSLELSSDSWSKSPLLGRVQRTKTHFMELIELDANNGVDENRFPRGASCWDSLPRRGSCDAHVRPEAQPIVKLFSRGTQGPIDARHDFPAHGRSQSYTIPAPL